MRRRNFIKLMGTAALPPSILQPLATRAQQSAMPTVGFLNTASAASFAHLTRAFLDGLREGGYVDGRNVAIEYRWAEGQSSRLPELAADLINRNVNVIVANATAALVAKKATTAIPIVFISGSDPVSTGLVASLNRPGGNLTGVAFFTGLLGPKRLELLDQLAPKAAVNAVLLDANQLDFGEQQKDAEAAVRAVGREIEIVKVHNEQEFDAAFAKMVQAKSGALLVGNSPFFTSQRRRIVALAARHALPASYTQREYVDAGGLMSYGPNVAAEFRQVGVYTARVLKGEKPADLPVDQATRFELVINRGTAKALGLDIPPTLLALADEVIE
jgi:putative tryptophan/tyrosine transport system substrate-binding protein